MNRFDICEAHALLENHFNVGGIVRERPSNTRRNASTGVQLHRMGYLNPMAGGFDDLSEDGKEVYLTNVVKWKLPIDDEIKRNLKTFFTKDWLQEHCPEVLKRAKSSPK
jgi:hypothetical protein